MKKIVVFLVSMLVILGAFSVNAEQSGVCGKGLTYTLSDDGVLEIKGSGAMDSTLPWKNNKADIKKIIISDEVTSVAAKAFNYCTELTEVIIGKSVIQIGDAAFSNATSLEKIVWNAVNVADFTISSQQFDYAGVDGEGIELTFGEGVERIPAYAFHSYSGRNIKVKSIIMADTVTEIGAYAFDKNTELETMKMSNGLKKIGKGAFENCSMLNVENWSSVIESIGDYAFENCTSLKTAIIPDTTTTLGLRAFNRCSGLEELYIGENIASIKDLTFCSTNSLKKITWNAVNVADFTSSSQQFDYAGINGEGIELIFGDGVEKIPAYAFHSYSGRNIKVKSITMSDTVAEIGAYAFDKNTELETMKMSNGLKKIGKGAFENCSKLDVENWSSVIESIGDYAFENCTSLKTAIIPDTTTTLGLRAFNRCSGLEELYIGENITSIKDLTFCSTNSLKKIIWNAKNVADFTNSSQQFDYAGVDGEGIELTFGEGVERIPAYAFYPYSGNVKIKSIKIAETINEIGNNAFYKCTQTESVNITDLSKWCNIEFENGNSNPLAYGAGLYLNGVLVENVLIPANTEKVGDYAFYKYKYAKSVEIPANVKTIGKEAFSGCTGLDSVAFDCGIESIGSGAFSGLSAIESVSFNGFKNDWEKVQVEANNDALKNISFIDEPGDSPKVDEGTAGENIVWVVYENGMLKITGFGDMIDISGLDIPWDKVTSVVIGDGITSISDGAFKDKDIKTAVLGKDVEEIGDEAFKNCDKLEDVYLPSGLAFIGASAFGGCGSLENIRYSGSSLDWDLIQFGGDDTGLPGGNVTFGGTPTTNTKVQYNEQKQTLTISSLEELDAILVGVTYGKNNEALEVKYVPVKIKAGRNTFESPITNFVDAYTVKFFIWKDISGIRSLCEPYVIKR